MNELHITKYNTINGDNFEEIDINKFINILSSNNYEVVVDKYLDFEIKYKTEVYKEKNGYIIIYNNNKYHINADNHPYLTKKLEGLSAITQKNINEKNNYNNLKDDKINNYHEYIGGLNYLEKVNHNAKRVANLSFVKLILSIIGVLPVILFLIGLICYLYSTALSFMISLIVSVAIGSISLGNLSENGVKYIKNIYNYGKIRRLTKNKIKQLKRELSRNRNMNTESYTSNTDNNDKYEDSVINYMNTIMNAVNKLGNEDRISKLLALRTILDEYTKECQRLNNNDNRGLTLNGGKRQIMMDTIEKLANLEMEIADIINRDTKNKILLSDNERLMQELENNLRNIYEENKQGRCSSKGR